MNGDIVGACASTYEQRVTQLCNDYVGRAAAAYRAGRYGYGRFLLARLELKIARLDGDRDKVEALSDLRFVQVGVDGSTVESIGAVR